MGAPPGPPRPEPAPPVPTWPAAPLRAEDVRYAPLDDVPLSGSMAIVGLPSVGAAGSLVARYLIPHLGMRLAGCFHCDRFLPAAAAHEGLMTSTLQVWAAPLRCGPEGSCDRLLVLKSDVPLDLALMAPLSHAVAAWAAREGVRFLLGIGSYPRREGERERVLVGSSAPARSVASRLAADPIDDAIVLGFDAALVAQANEERLMALVVLGQRDERGGDGRAAASALRAAGPLLPALEVAAPGLEADLEALERKLARQLEEALAAARGESHVRGYA